MLGGLLGCRLGMSRAGRCLHTDDRAENKQSIDRAGGVFLGHRTVGEEKIGGDGMRNGCEEAALDMVEFDGLVTQQRVRRQINLEISIGGEMLERKIFGAAHSFEQEFAQGNRDGDFRDDVFFERAEKIKAARGVVEDRRCDLG